MKRLASTILLSTLAATGSLAAFASPGAYGSGHGDPLASTLRAVKDQLNLNTSQQQQWDTIVAQGKTSRETAQANFAQVKTALSSELAKPEPDLAAVAAVADSVQAQNNALRKQQRDAWLALYATFTPAQKGIVRDAISARLARLAAFREHMRERLSQ